jgi:hypothetical protein
MRGLQVYHAAMHFVLSNVPSTTTPVTPDIKPGEPIVLLSMDGRQNFGDAQWSFKGLFMAFLSGRATDTFEVRALKDRVYMKGPMPAIGLAEDRWYYKQRIPQLDLSDTSPGAFLDDISSPETTLPMMRTAGAEVLDDKGCSIYRGADSAAVELFLRLGSRLRLDNTMSRVRDNIERGVLNVWVCDDGYVHKLEAGIRIHPPAGSTEPQSFDVTLRLNDFNIIVPIQEPTDAIPVPNPPRVPGFGEPLRTPTPGDQTY